MSARGGLSNGVSSNQNLILGLGFSPLAAARNWKGMASYFKDKYFKYAERSVEGI